MGYQLKSHIGTVVYIDLLGFSALTNAKINLEDRDFEPWLADTGHPYNHQFLAAHLLVQLREILQLLDGRFPRVTVAQLSDCFFAWSTITEDVVRFTHAFMHEAIRSGLLCRGGMAHGEIIETEQNHELGRLLLGYAVTKAASLEGIPKGARILTEQEVVHSLEAQSDNPRIFDGFFAPFENPLDYEVYDEFVWYLVDDLNTLPNHGSCFCKEHERIQFTKNRLHLDSLLLHGPKFGWNAKNIHGLQHLKATSNFLSATGLLHVEHTFSRRGFSEIRSTERLGKISEIVDHDGEYTVSG